MMVRKLIETESVSGTPSKAYFWCKEHFDDSTTAFCLVLILFLFYFYLPPPLLSTALGNFCQSGSAGLPHSAGRAYLIRGKILHSYNDGNGELRHLQYVHQQHLRLHVCRFLFFVFFMINFFLFSPTSSSRTGRC